MVPAANTTHIHREEDFLLMVLCTNTAHTVCEVGLRSTRQGINDRDEILWFTLTSITVTAEPMRSIRAGINDF